MQLNKLTIAPSTDLLSISHGIIAHQVNLQGFMNAGLAKQVRAKYPKAYDCYYRAWQAQWFKLGMIQPVQVAETLWVVNMAAQDRYGRDRRYTDYDALRICLTKLNQWSIDRDLQAHLPYGLGCGLAGGDWSIVSQMIVECVPSAIVCRLEE